MQTFRIGYRLDHFLEFEIDDYVVIIGNTYHLKRELIFAMEKMFQGKSLSDMEFNYYGHDAILSIDGKEVKAKDVLYVPITQYSSLEKFYSLKKGSLFYDKLMRLHQNYEINHQISKINDELLRLEVIMNDLSSNLIRNIDIGVQHLEMATLLKNFVTFTYEHAGEEVPLESLTLDIAYQDIVNLLRMHIEESAQLVIILLDLEPFRAVSYESTEFIKQLLQLAEETHLLKLIIFDDGDLNQRFVIDTAKTIVVADDVQQMPEFNLFKESIARHYPDSLTITEEELQQRFYRICKYLGHSIATDISISPKDMILLYVVKDLLGDTSHIETSIDDLSQAERAYLTYKSSN